MRGALLVGFAGLLGCNQIFGLKPTTEQDAAPPFEAGEAGIDGPDSRTILITKFIVDSQGVGAARATTIDTLTPLDADPHAQAGLIDQPLVDLTYTNGLVKIPIDLPGHAWRLVATLDGVVHEYQWKVEVAHVTAAVQYGNPAPIPIPSGSSYSMTVPNQTYKDFEFTTSGVVTDTHLVPGINAGPQTTPFVFDLSQVTAANTPTEPLVGPLGAPQSARGDWQLFVGFQRTDTGGNLLTCRPSNVVAYQSADLVAGGPTVTTPTVSSALKVWPAPTISGNGGGSNRFFVMGERFTGDAATTYDLAEFGYVIDGGVPSFERVKRTDDVDHIATRRSPMVNLMDCRSASPTGGTFTLPQYVDVPELAAPNSGMVSANYVELSTQRRISTNSSYVISSLQGISQTSAVPLAAPLAKAIAFDGLSLEESLAAGADAPDYKQTVALGTARQITLTWSYETGVTGVNAAPDDVTVVLYNVASALSRSVVRVYHTTGTQIVVDSSVFDKTKYPTRNFVFEVIARVGVPNAATGDYANLTYPMSSASVFPYAFHVSP